MDKNIDFSTIKNIKMVDVDMFYEYYLIIWYKDGKNETIFFDTSEEVNREYNRILKCMKDNNVIFGNVETDTTNKKVYKIIEDFKQEKVQLGNQEIENDYELRC